MNGFRSLPSLLAALLCGLLALPAKAGEPAAPAQNKIVVLEVGKPAPFTGNLVPEARFVELLQQQDCPPCPATPNLPCDVYTQSKVMFWVGLVVGVVASSATVYGAYKVIEVVK